MEHLLHHTTMGFCWWDIPMAIILIAVAALFIVRHKQLKNTQKELEDQLSTIYADKAEEMSSEV